MPADETLEDFTKLPNTLDAQYDRLDPEGALRPAIITPKSGWTRKNQTSLSNQTMNTKTLNKDDLESEKSKAFDLIDALSRSGALHMDAAELHVVIASCHSFNDTLINTVIKKNVNPVNRVERSSLIVASTIYKQQPNAICKENCQLHSIEHIANNN